MSKDPERDKTFVELLEELETSTKNFSKEADKPLPNECDNTNKFILTTAAIIQIGALMVFIALIHTFFGFGTIDLGFLSGE